MVSTNIMLAKALPAIFLLVSSATANSFGNYLSTGHVNSGNTIIVANSTLVLPAAPKPLKNEVALWVGMAMSNGDLIQSLALSYPGSTDEGCGEVGDKWCITASTLESGKNYQSDGKTAVAEAGDEIKMSYIYDSATEYWKQYVYINGDLASTFNSSKSALAQGWGTAEECQPGTPCGYVAKHRWIDSVLVLSKADPSYGSTLAMNGATGTISTPDGGKTWKLSTITINRFDFTTGQ